MEANLELREPLDLGDLVLEVADRFPDHPSGYLRASVAARKLGRTQEARQLTLAHQYGPDFLNDKTNDQK